MKQSIRQILFFDRMILILTCAILLAFFLSISLFIYADNIESQNSQLKSRLNFIKSLAGDAIRLKRVVESREKKIDRSESAGIVSTLEQTLKDLGLDAQVIKPLDRVKLDDYAEENAELEMQGTDLNSIVNLLYKINISPLPLKIKSATIKTSFQDPDKFILKLTVSLISKS